MTRHLILLLAGAVTLAAGCESSEGATEDEMLRSEATAAVAQMKSRDPGIARFFDEAYGYVVFPDVGKGGLIVGGAHGRGLVYEQGELVGSASLSQGTIGAQIGGQAYTEVIFFKDKAALDHFKSGNFEFSGQASAVAVKAGAAATANYDNGVAVFTMPKAGLMLEASIGGQRFTYHPKM